MKTNDFITPRSRALGHLAIMHNNQHGPDAEVDKSHHCQESRQLNVIRKHDQA
jgi:hypothetical protein